jgi:formamidopyrimidine-DNA glycosylase
MRGRTFTHVRRHAKFLFMELDDGATLTAHLGMTGKFLFAPAGAARRPHTHAVWTIDGEQELQFIDPRRFGLLRLHAPGERAEEADHYGVDALDSAHTPKALAALLATSRAPLKAFLLDQTKVSGIGNIYACEALWRARLSPRRKACNTPAARVADLHGAILDVLNESIAAGGTSFNDYVDSIGQPGSFLLAMNVFQREGQSCPRCATAVRRLVQSGRSTFYCPGCQR